MTQQIINIGTTPGDSTGDVARTAFDKANDNFTELYAKGATEGVWNFQATSTDTSTAPVSGRFVTNSGNYRDATQLAIHATTIQGIDRDDTLRTLRIGDIIQCQDRSNGAAWCRYVLQALPTDNTTWFQLSVALDSDGGVASGDNQEIIFTFTANISGSGGGGGITDAPSDGVRYVRQNAGWVSGDAAYATPTQVALKADLASPTFTGDPQAPTPATADNDTSIATTAFVKAQGYLTGNQTVTLSGDITGAGATAIAATIANNAVSNAKLADMATARLRGRVTAGTGDPEDLTGTQATTLLDVFTSALKGLTPSSGGGTTNFLRADATWAAPPGGGFADAPSDGTLYGRVSAAWVRGVKLAGDTMTGQLALSYSNPILRVIKAASGEGAAITGQVAGNLRWNLTLGDTVAESGSNAGSNLLISRYTDAGALIDNPFQITRSTGLVKIPNLQALAPSVSQGTISSGTLVIDAANGNMQHYTNGGAHTLSAGITNYTVIVECQNAAAGAGAITFSFTIVDGDTFTTNANRKHLFYITRTITVSRCTVVYVTGT